MTEILQNNYVFKHPFTCLIAGPTQSGKTTVLEKFLKQKKELFTPEINRIIYYYARWQTKYNELKSNLPLIDFHQGLYDIDSINEANDTMLILDDLNHTVLHINIDAFNFLTF